MTHSIIPSVFVDIGVIDGLWVLLDPAWSLFLEQAHSGRSTRTSIDPHDHGILLGVAAGFEEVKEEIISIACIEVAGVRLDLGITPSLVRLDPHLVFLPISALADTSIGSTYGVILGFEDGIVTSGDLGQGRDRSGLESVLSSQSTSQ